MAGMFYSLQEVAEKLNKTEEQVKELVQQGRLREFRDGPNLLFKAEEVQSLLSDSAVMSSRAASPAPDSEAGDDEISLAPESAEEEISLEDDFTSADTTVANEDLAVLDEADTEAGTAIIDDGVDILGEADSEYSLSDDTKSETKAEIGSSEMSLEEIEGDVNLDSFGTGSGLLDLSLQADDTSLGGILDEIYTPGEEGQADDGAPGEMETPLDAEQMLTSVGIEAQQAETAASIAVRSYVEPAPDAVSNTFGYVLFLPLLAVIYTAIIALAGLNGIMPAALKSIQGIVWYIMIGLAAASLVIIAVPLMFKSGGAKAGKKTKVKKAKKEKKPKKKKEKKAKS